MTRVWILVMRRRGQHAVLRVWASSEREATSKIPASYDDWACTRAEEQR